MRPYPTTTRKTLGQVLVCFGCCCGQTAKGHPAVPVEWLKAEWRRRMLPKAIQLTISGCLGPCDVSNVVCVFRGGTPEWYGGLSEMAHYEALADWAEASAGAGYALPLPELLEPFRLERFRDPIPTLIEV